MNPPFDIAADLHTPVSAFLRLAPLGPRYLLESVDGGHLGRFSFIGFGETKSFDVGRGSAAGVLGDLRTALATVDLLHPRTAPGPFSGGLVGVAGFDLVRSLHRLPTRHPVDGPVASYLATGSLLVFDHLTRRIALLHHDETARPSLRSEVVSILGGSLSTAGSSGGHKPPVATMDKAEFVDKVETVRHHIAAGDVYQLVLSIGFSGHHDLDPFQVYRALRLLNPSPYMYYLDIGGRQVIGSSPEALVRLNGDRAQLWPIAGTRRRGADLEEDTRMEEELLADPKEAAEHVMLVDLARNDMGRAAVAGSVRVEPFRGIERYSHVMHMVSGVNGHLRPELDAFDLFSATFPAGTVVGAPKLAALELIDRLEPAPRGLYSGTVGYFGSEGSMDHAIAIRTIVIEGDSYSYQAGAGIVADSDPDREHDEVLSKGAAMVAALVLAEEGV
jgi:anthranilate synthase component I